MIPPPRALVQLKRLAKLKYLYDVIENPTRSRPACIIASHRTPACIIAPHPTPILLFEYEINFAILHADALNAFLIYVNREYVVIISKYQASIRI
jgi:hypothetical protein